MLSVRLQQLAYLSAVARHGHFGDAADELLVSQPALSQGLARLETAVGSKLFEKQGRSHRLTPAGEETLAFARRVLAEADRLDDRLRARREGRAGTLRLGLIDAAALYLLRDEVEAFRSAYPDVELQLTVDTSGRLLDALERFELDIAVVIGPAPNDDAIEVIREPLYVYGPPIDDLRDAHQWVLYPERSRTRRFIDQALATHGVIPVVRSESTNPSVIAELVRLGGGWTVLPAGIAEAISDPLPRRSEAIAERPLVAVTRPNAPDDPLVTALLTIFSRLSPPTGI